MENINNTRRHDLDWLRFIAIAILLFFHTGMLFNTWGFHIKNEETTTTFNYWMVWSHFFRMPLLLFISGAGTYIALGRRSAKQFAGERFKRLFIPLVFGMFVVVPPQIYFEHINKYDGYSDFYKTVFEFVPYPIGSFSWHHLWFILYLLIYSLIALPLLTFLRSPNSNGLKDRFMKLLMSPVGILMIPACFILITQVILRPYFPDERHDLTDWSYFVFYFCFFVFGIICYSNQALWESIGKNRKHLLVACLFILVPFYTFVLHHYDVITLPWSSELISNMFDVCALFVSWFSVITIIGFGQHYLSKPHPWLSKINEALYPFYILHQTAIIAIGYYVCQLPWSISAKFWVVSLLTLISCLAFYMLIIKPFNVMRFLFGMKPLTKKAELVTHKSVETIAQV